MGVEVAGQGLDRGAPVVAGIALLEGLDLRDQGVQAEQGEDAAAP